MKVHILKPAVIVLIITAAYFLSFGCGKKKEQTNIKVCGYYEVVDRWYMNVGNEVLDGTLDYTMTITPVGEEDTVSLNNVNKTFDNVKAVVNGDSIYIYKQTLISKSGKKYDIMPYGGIMKDKKLDITFEFDDRPYDNLTGGVLCGITGTQIKQISEIK